MRQLENQNARSLSQRAAVGEHRGECHSERDAAPLVAASDAESDGDLDVVACVGGRVLRTQRAIFRGVYVPSTRAQRHELWARGFARRQRQQQKWQGRTRPRPPI